MSQRDRPQAAAPLIPGSAPLRLGGSRFPVVAAALIVLTAICLGGSTERGTQGLVVSGIGILLAVCPARRWPRPGFGIACAGLLLLAAAGFLPASWFSSGPLRAWLGGFGVHTPPTLSPQPWLTVEGGLLLSAGLIWTAWLAAFPWNSTNRRAGAQILASGLTAVAGVLLVAWAAGWRVPGWLSDQGFAPFPNRNHTGHVLALGGVMAIGCAADSARRGLWRALPWILGGGVILAALAVNYSRGGMLLFFVALILWTSAIAWGRRSWKTFVLGLTALIVAGSAVLVFGGPIARRFAGESELGVGFRGLIWRDTLVLIHEAPWCGVGLDNFRALFAFYRTASVIQSTVLHPESDWLWLAAELGWPGVALACAALGSLIATALPLARGTQRRLRGAALAGAIAAALHGVVEVSGHRLGSALTALFVLALSQRDTAPAPSPRAAAGVCRLLGLALLLGGIWMVRIPDDRLQAEKLSRAGAFTAARAAATRAIQRAPLDWRPYFTRAGAWACAGKTLEAVYDFHRANLLEPRVVALPMEEGRFWVRIQPEMAFTAWTEALGRVSSPEDEAVFSAILSASPDSPAFRARLLALVKDRPELQIMWFEKVPPEEARPFIAELSAAAERCGPRQRAAFERRAASLGRWWEN